VGLVEPGAHAYPALQLPLQVEFVSPDTDPYFPASQSPLQLAFGMPDTAPYSPATHTVHTPAPVKLYRPAGHNAAVAVVDPATHAYPALQFPLHVDDDKPLTDPYDPASHGPLHITLPMPAIAPYRPALQFVHTPDDVLLYLPGGQITSVRLLVPGTHA
jgi:hypothetical protein